MLLKGKEQDFLEMATVCPSKVWTDGGYDCSCRNREKLIIQAQYK